MTTNRFCEITHELQHLSKLSEQCARIDPALYAKYDVKRGLRDINGKGVLVGLTEISDVCSTKMIDGKLRPADGELYYRGYNVKDIIDGTSVPVILAASAGMRIFSTICSDSISRDRKDPDGAAGRTTAAKVRMWNPASPSVLTKQCMAAIRPLP